MQETKGSTGPSSSSAATTNSRNNGEDPGRSRRTSLGLQGKSKKQFVQFLSLRRFGPKAQLGDAVHGPSQPTHSTTVQTESCCEEQVGGGCYIIHTYIYFALLLSEQNEFILLFFGGAL